MATTSRHLTYRDLAALPDDGKRYELLEGEVYMTPPPSVEHQSNVGELHAWLHRAQEAGYGRAFVAPIGVLLAEDILVEPDALFVRRERLAIVGEQYIEGAPDLVCEVLSPGTRRRDLTIKYQLYARGGVSDYRVVDPTTRTVTCYALAGGAYVEAARLTVDDVLTSDLFPGITLPVRALFRA